MSLETVMNYDESINYLKSKFTIDYSKFIEKFSNFKFTNVDSISYIKIDDYAVTNITTIYNFNDLISWSQKNNIRLIEFHL